MSKERFTGINKLLLAQFAYDQIVQPKGSEYFGARDINGNDVPMEQQKVYINDSFGLKTVNEAGKIQKEVIYGGHMQFGQSNFNMMAQFLKSGVSLLVIID